MTEHEIQTLETQVRNEAIAEFMSWKKPDKRIKLGYWFKIPDEFDF